MYKYDVDGFAIYGYGNEYIAVKDGRVYMGEHIPRRHTNAELYPIPSVCDNTGAMDTGIIDTDTMDTGVIFNREGSQFFDKYAIKDVRLKEMGFDDLYDDIAGEIEKLESVLSESTGIQEIGNMYIRATKTIYIINDYVGYIVRNRHYDLSQYNPVRCGYAYNSDGSLNYVYLAGMNKRREGVFPVVTSNKDEIFNVIRDIIKNLMDILGNLEFAVLM
jgi:hypothetical protein